MRGSRVWQCVSPGSSFALRASPLVFLMINLMFFNREMIFLLHNVIILLNVG